MTETVQPRITTLGVPSHDPALHAFNAVVRTVGTQVTLDGVLNAAGMGIIDSLGFRAVVINLVTGPETLEVVVDVGEESGHLLGHTYDLSRFLGDLRRGERWGESLYYLRGDVTTQLEGVHIPDEPPRDHPDAWLPEDALFAVARDHERNVVAVISVDLPHDGLQPGPSQRQLLDMFAAHTGLAISHARAREALHDQVRLSSVARRVVQKASESATLDELVEKAVAPLCVGFRTERAWMRIKSDHQGGDPVVYPRDVDRRLRDAIGTGEGVLGELDVTRVFEALDEAAARCWRDQRSLLVSLDQPVALDPVLSPGRRGVLLAYLKSAGDHTFALVPVGAGRSCYGFVAISRAAHAGPWSELEDEALLQVGRELGSAVRSAEIRERERSLLRSLREADSQRSEMIATLVHELKNPLTSIQGNLEIADEDPESLDRAHKAIGRNSARMLGLVNDLLMLTKLETGQVADHSEPVDLSELVTEVANALRVQASRAGVTVSDGGVERGVVVHGDPTSLRHLVMNIASNAVKFSDSGGVVRLSLTRGDDGTVRLRVADQGIGMSPEDQAGAFGVFHRSRNPEARARPGTGLGLTIVQRVVERMGGEIRIDSALGRGTTFEVVLPVGG